MFYKASNVGELTAHALRLSGGGERVDAELVQRGMQKEIKRRHPVADEKVR